MTDAELESISKACAEATPGPWMSDEWCGVCQVLDGGAHSRVAQVEWDEPGGDAYFIAGARSWVPALVDEVRRLRARNEEAEGLLEEVWSSWGARSTLWVGRIVERLAKFLGRPLPPEDLERALKADLRAEAYKKAARVADSITNQATCLSDPACMARVNTAMELAAAIRALAKGEG